MLKAYAQILDLVSIRPQTTAELHNRIDHKLIGWFDDALRMARDDGVIVCTNGVWWKR